MSKTVFFWNVMRMNDLIRWKQLTIDESFQMTLSIILHDSSDESLILMTCRIYCIASYYILYVKAIAYFMKKTITSYSGLMITPLCIRKKVFFKFWFSELFSVPRLALNLDLRRKNPNFGLSHTNLTDTDNSFILPDKDTIWFPPYSP